MRTSVGGWIFDTARRLARGGRREAIYRKLLAEGHSAGVKSLEELFSYVNRFVPYYRDHPGLRFSKRNLGRLPPLTKDLIRANFDRLQSDCLSGIRYHRNSSGGSTGQPITLLQDTDWKDWAVATEDFFYRQLLGMEFNHTSKFVLWGSERDIFEQTQALKTRLANWLTKTRFYNAFLMSRSDLNDFVSRFNRCKPDLLKGYAGSLYQVSVFIRERGLAVHSPRFIVSSAERLTDAMRQEIEEVFQCKVFNFYGSRETGPIAGECARGKMHLFSFHNWTEIVDKDGLEVGAHEEGHVLVTTLRNRAMPLIRYAIGDMASKGGPCRCGLDLPTLNRVTGRITDHFLTPRGKLVNGEYFTHLFYHCAWIKEFQVIQKKRDLIEIHYVPLDVPDREQCRDIEGKIRLVMGADCRIRWIESQQLPSTPQGKFLYTRSLVSQESGFNAP